MDFLPKDIKKILVVMLGGIGDLILLTPALKALRQHFSSAEIVLLTGEPGVEAVLAGEGVINRVVLLNRKGGSGWRKAFSLIRKMRKEKFDLSLAASGTNAFNASLLMYLLGISRRVGVDVKQKGFWYTKKIKYDPQENESEGSLRLLEAMGVPADERFPTLHLQPEEKAFIDGFLVGENIKPGDILVGMHAGSGPKMQDQKRWPKEKFAQLAEEAMSHSKVKVVFTGGDQEKELIDEIKGLMKEKPISSAGRLTIRQTAALIQRCRLFVANDSGIAHVAASVKTPLIVLFGPTDVQRIGPRGKDVVIVKKAQGLGKLTVAEVRQILEEKINAAS